MRLRSFAIEGLGVFDPTELKLSECPGVVALSSPNGSGKSTALEAMGPGILYRELPSRDPSGLQACRLVSCFEHDGHEHEAEINVPAKGKATAYLTRDGKKVKAASGAVGGYDEAIEAIFGLPKALFYATYFSLQGRFGAFHLLQRAERRSIFRGMLALDHLQEISDEAKRQLAGMVDAARKIEWLDGEVAKQRELGKVAASEVSISKAAVEEARKKVAVLEKRRDELTALRANAGVVELFCKAKDAVTALEADLANSDEPDREFLAQRDKIAEALETLRAQVEVCGQKEVIADALERDIERAREDAATLRGVPCGGAGKFAACRFLTRATAAKERLPELGREFALALEGGGNLDDLREKLRQAKELAVDVTAEGHLSSDYDRLVYELAEARSRAAELEKRLPPSGDTDLPTEAQIQQVGRDLREAQYARDGAVSHHARLDERVAAAESAVVSAERELAELRAAAGDYEPLKLLQRAFAPDGIQAHEIEAARPRVEALANQLLGPCYEDRFRVELRTERENKSGGRSEDFDLVVFDNRRGDYTTVRGLSGGEGTVVSEAFSIATCLFNVEHGGAGLKTLWRDERTDALDAENAARYVEMLRTARELGGFEHVFFTTHIGHCVEAADHVIRVGGRTARIES